MHTQQTISKIKEYPVFFKLPLIQAILNTRDRAPIDPKQPIKWQTRRPIKPQPDDSADLTQLIQQCPIGKVRDRLWIKETIYGYLELKITKTPPKNWTANSKLEDFGNYWYATDTEAFEEWSVYTSALHCPRWAARLFLDITNVRVEHVQDISGADARAEGIAIFERDRVSLPEEGGLIEEIYRDQFAKLWNSIYQKDNLGWSVNPFVWVQEFRLLEAC